MTYCTGATARRAITSIAVGLLIVFLSIYARNTRSYSQSAQPYGCSLSPFKPACYHLTDSVAHSRAVAMSIHNSARLQVNETQSSIEFLAMLPSGRHTVSVPWDGPNGHGENVPHTVALFHQIRCIEAIREAYAKRLGETHLSRHCLNYLRQSLLCLSDTKLEPAITPFFGRHTVDSRSNYVCRNWTAVYAAADMYNNLTEQKS
ncbi:hypothetical protein CONPUDRAFT_111454 [Coniophora puteana RWD-64-598 SS2]|uniref:Uncharacterized protein n=1 Tax=Coniophora puteana (strain RWD-64-598) TaxID=741705 RepID=A0A5M3MB67_CONPW|nr:uncharacterized protein CONPUDRAFT_111454 [Coniophora puteana RWD-64-598 SS2]EIW76479.1 hypothetical protein CONPUDRAFT_111454 [Coniophora puteana RWD-64-598 SS2]